MTELILFHHAHGLTEGVLALAGKLRAAGHVVHVPDLYEGRTYAELSQGVDYAERVGFDTIVERGQIAAHGLPADVVYAGLSLGVLPAQMLRRRARAPGERCWSTPASLRPSSAAPGRRASRSRST